MNKASVLIAIMAITVLVPPAMAGGKSEPAKPTVAAGQSSGSTNALVGTWKRVSGTYGGRESRLAEGMTTVKHVTPTHFMVATYGQDGKMTRAIGGSYTLNGAQYKEMPEYGIGGDFDIVKAQSQMFNWRVEQNKWHVTGTLSNGMTLEEVWERVQAM